MSILNAQVSWFRNYYDTTPSGTVSLLQWLQSKKLQQSVEAVRAIPCKKERDAAKSHLPAITPSGIFTARNSQGLITHSGIICIDIDQTGNEDIENYNELRTELCKLKQVAYCGKSVSGTGFFLMIPIKYPERHKEHFAALKQQLLQWGIVIDNKCGNIDRLRGASFDSDAYYNHEAIPFTGLPNKPVNEKKQYTTPAMIEGNVFEQAIFYTEKIHRNRLEPGGRHWYILRVAEYLASKGVSYADACQWIYTNVLPADEINSNCISYPYLQQTATPQPIADPAPLFPNAPTIVTHCFLAAYDDPADMQQISTPMAPDNDIFTFDGFVMEAKKQFARSMVKDPAKYFPAFIQSYLPTIRRMGIDEIDLRVALNAT